MGGELCSLHFGAFPSTNVLEGHEIGERQSIACLRFVKLFGACCLAHSLPVDSTYRFLVVDTPLMLLHACIHTSRIPIVPTDRGLDLISKAGQETVIARNQRNGPVFKWPWVKIPAKIDKNGWCTYPPTPKYVCLKEALPGASTLDEVFLS